MKFTRLLLIGLSAIFAFFTNACGGGGGGSVSVLPSTDSFTQSTNADIKIDILFVVDDSGSMKDEQQALYDYFIQFINLFYDKNFDFRVAVAKTSAYGTSINCKKINANGTFGGNTTCNSSTTGTRPYYKKDTAGNFIAGDYVSTEGNLTPKEFRCGYGNNCGLNSEFQKQSVIAGTGDGEGEETLMTTIGNGTPAEDTDHILASSKLTKSEMIAKFGRNILVGLPGTGDERGIESAETVIRNMKQFYAAENQFPRPNSHLAIIHVGDEGDGPIPNSAGNALVGSNRGSSASTSTWGSLRSSFINNSTNWPGYDAIELVERNNYVLNDHLSSVESYLAALKKHQSTSTVSVHAIEDLPNSSNKVSYLPSTAFDTCGSSKEGSIGYFQAYMAYKSTGGLVLSKCNDFSESLAALGDQISSLASSFEVPYLDELARENLVVKVNGAVVPKSDTNGWSYDVSTSRISFNGEDAIPPQGALIQLEYTAATL